VTGKPEITREQAGVARKEQVGGLQAECFFPIQPGESMGYWGHCVGFAGLKAKVFSYNKRTMDRAMGPF
jgi:hypothetical protein